MCNEYWLIASFPDLRVTSFTLEHNILFETSWYLNKSKGLEKNWKNFKENFTVCLRKTKTSPQMCCFVGGFLFVCFFFFFQPSALRCWLFYFGILKVASLIMPNRKGEKKNERAMLGKLFKQPPRNREVEEKWNPEGTMFQYPSQLECHHPKGNVL